MERPGAGRGVAPLAGYAHLAGDASKLQGKTAAEFRSSTWVPGWADLAGAPADSGTEDCYRGYGGGSGTGEAHRVFDASILVEEMEF